MRCHDSHPGSATRKVNKAEGPHGNRRPQATFRIWGPEMPVGAVRTAA